MTDSQLLASVREWAGFGGEGWTILAGRSMNVLQAERFNTAHFAAERYMELVVAECPVIQVFHTSYDRVTTLIASAPAL